jgi:AraC family transcriptional regulator, regulatory protein of adaptative response / methylated-DNA-[protein]-cysteine methyltransferase
VKCAAFQGFGVAFPVEGNRPIGYIHRMRTLRNRRPLPSPDVMYAALAERDPTYEGIFFFGVRSTGVFCRPGCPARTPRFENVRYFTTPGEAATAGFRPCRRCAPTEPRGKVPPMVHRLLRELDAAPSLRLRDRDLRNRGIDPTALRRWFRKHHGMTFQEYHRTGRLAFALGALCEGAGVTRTAYDSGYESLSAFREAIHALTGRPPNRNRDAMVLRTSRILTPLGPMILGATDDAVRFLEFADGARVERQLDRLSRALGCVAAPGANPVSDGMQEELERYFQGDIRTFRTPLSPAGTEFQLRAWEALRAIPYGETRSYAEQARAMGRPTAVRAVARANGANRIAIAIPCHRVIGADGTLTGYGGGLERKRFLLELEGG